MAGERQWLRYCRLVVAKDGTNMKAVDLSNFRVRFRVSQAVVARPCTAEITVYNVSQETINAIDAPTNEFVRNSHISVTLEAGYQEKHAVIFKGDLWWKSTGTESETDTFLRLIAATGDRAHSFAVTIASLPKGSTPLDVVGAAAGSMEPYGVRLAETPDVAQEKLLRGKTIFKMARDVMQDIADSNGLDWNYSPRGLLTVKKEGAVASSGKVVVLTQASGLLDRPEITTDGLRLRTLLNPDLEWGQIIQIDTSASTKRPDLSTETSAGAITQNQASQGRTLDADGLYIVKSREFVGDTRGDEWYADLLCIGYNPEAPVMTATAFNTIPNLK